MRAESTAGDGGVKRDHLKFGIHHAVREQRTGLAAVERDEPWEIMSEGWWAARGSNPGHPD
jgi:hypothetical protein